jgi:hypothetical protein
MRPQCKYVHLLEDFVEVKNGYVAIRKEAILGNCSTNECKFIIFVLKNFNGKYFLLIIPKLGVRTLMPLLQPPLLQQIIHINHLFSFHLSYSFSLYSYKQERTYVSFLFFSSLVLFLLL